MQGYTRVTFSELCRLCATNRVGDRVDVFMEQGMQFRLQTKLQTLVNIKVTINDNLPKVICTKCLDKLEELQRFWNACHSSEIMLNNFYNRAKNTEYFKQTGTVYIQNSELNLDGNDGTNEINIIKETHAKSAKIVKNSKCQVAKPKIQQPHNSNQSIKITNHKAPPQAPQNKVVQIKTEPNTNTMQTLTTNELASNNTPQTIIVQVYDSNETSQTPAKLGDDGEMYRAGFADNLTNNVPVIKEEPPTTKQYICAQCGKRFKRREHLFQHAKLHTGLRPYKCGHCPKAFVRKEHLLRHSTCHTGQKTHRCDVCSKSFSRNDNLLKHRKTHEKTPSFTCVICPKIFILKHYYDQHMEAVHKCVRVPSDDDLEEMHTLS